MGSTYAQLRASRDPFTGAWLPAPAADPAHPLHRLWQSERDADNAAADADEPLPDALFDGAPACCSHGCDECTGGRW